jgi:hypothetical protein
MSEYTLKISEDEALVLFAYFSRIDETDDLSFRHPAEYVVLQRLAGQIDKTTSAMFKPDYTQLLAAARERVAAGFEGQIPCLKSDENA